MYDLTEGQLRQVFNGLISHCNFLRKEISVSTAGSETERLFCSFYEDAKQVMNIVAKELSNKVANR